MTAFMLSLMKGHFPIIVLIELFYKESQLDLRDHCTCTVHVNCVKNILSNSYMIFSPVQSSGYSTAVLKPIFHIIHF